MARATRWELSEEVWERAQPLLPERKPHPRGGRPPRDDRQMLGAILYVLRTGLQWNALPHEIGASTTVYDRFRAWEADGFFGRLWAAGLAEFDAVVGIDWEWQRLDGVMTKAPFGRAATAEAEGSGHNPTDRGKHGTKRSTLSEGQGLPLAVGVGGADGRDLKVGAPAKSEKGRGGEEGRSRWAAEHLKKKKSRGYEVVYVENDNSKGMLMKPTETETSMY